MHIIATFDIHILIGVVFLFIELRLHLIIRQLDQLTHTTLLIDLFM
jgi:hypothetical protein